MIRQVSRCCAAILGFGLGLAACVEVHHHHTQPAAGGDATGGDPSSGGTLGQGGTTAASSAGGTKAASSGGTKAASSGGTKAASTPVSLPVYDAKPVLPGCPSAATPVDTHGALAVDGPTLIDKCSGGVQLKGVSSMWLNWESKPFAESKSGLQYMRDNWKLSVIRASMGTENQGGYLTGAANQTSMLNKVNTIVQNAIDSGVYVIIDWHTQVAVNQQADAVSFFTSMAQKWGKYPNVIFEPYNEPFGFTWTQVKPYHQAVVQAIRGQGSNNIIVLGTTTYSQDVDIAAADPVSGTNLMYTLHFYACTHGASIRNRAEKAIDAGLPVFITEFGATTADGGLVSKGDNYICENDTNLWFDWIATHNLSAIAWKLEQCTDSSCILASSAPVDGPWPDNQLTSDANSVEIRPTLLQGGGHGLFIVNWLRQ
jgi:endoglucanase